MGLGDPVAYVLASTGRGHGRGDGRELEMPEDARDHRLLGDDGDDPERAPVAPGTRGQLQAKDSPQEPRPGPIWGARVRVLSVHPLVSYTI
jgi:hypothetical protein